MLTTLLPKCLCGSTDAHLVSKNGLTMLYCPQCTVYRQHVPLTHAELADWYRAHYLDEAYTHSVEHDRAVARTRLRAYRLTSDTRLLDVGCGNGAFVAEARAHGIEAWGQDLAATSESEYVYVGDLATIAFPTESFDVITVHDVLEHVPDPRAMLREIRRLLRRPGKLIVDFPRFDHEAGRHHWKPTEHLWMLHEQQLAALLMDEGFNLTAISHPIPSKIVVEAERVPETRPQILVPPGIGDALWSVVKLPGFLKHHGLTMPDVWVQDAGGPRRTRPFLRTLPFLHAAGYKALSDKDPVFHEAYMQNARTVFEGVADTDYFIAYNGILRHGRRLDAVDREYGCDWRPRMHISKEALRFCDQLQGGGRYILTYYAEAGMYRRWLAECPAAQIVRILERVAAQYEAQIVFMGAPWDRGQVGREIARTHPEWIDLIGATSYDQMVGAILGAHAVVGFPAGNTILATVLNRPTVLFWNRYFDRRFWTSSCPPDAPYRALDTHELTPGRVVGAMEAVLEMAGATT